MESDQLNDAADTVSDTAAGLAGKAGETISKAASAARETAGEIGEKGYAVAGQATRYVGETVREQPLLSLIGIAAIGYAIGYLLHAPSSPLAPTPPKARYFGR